MEFKAKSFQELSTREIYEILRSRAEVFVVEQGIMCVDPDGVDPEAFHCFYVDEGRVIAYLRAYISQEHPSAVKIGRVLTLQHGKGYGRLLMEESMPRIAEYFGCRRLLLNAQKHAEGFYLKLGFRTISDEFLEEGVVHVTMERSL